MAQIDLEQWVSTENIARYRDWLSDPTHEAQHNQVEDLLARELIKLQTMFPN